MYGLSAHYDSTDINAHSGPEGYTLWFGVHFDGERPDGCDPVDTFGLHATDELDGPTLRLIDADGTPCEGWNYEGPVLSCCAQAELPADVERDLPGLLRDALEHLA